MKRKYILGLTSALTVVAPIASTISCGDNGDVSKTIAIVVSNQSNSFFQKIIDSTKAEVEKNGYKLVVFDSNDKAEKELGNINTIVTKKYAGVIWNPTSAAVKNAANKLVSAKIPFTFVDRNIDGITQNIAFTRTDNKLSAKNVVEKAIDKYNQKYPSDLLNLKNIFHLQGIDGSSAAKDRNNGFIEAIEAKFSSGSIPKTNNQRADFKPDLALTKVNAWKTKKLNINLIFAENDKMASGAEKAYEGKNAYPMIVGFDGDDSAKTKIDSGKIYATVEQDTESMGKNAAQIILEVLKNDDNIILSIKKDQTGQDDLLQGKIYSNENWPNQKS